MDVDATAGTGNEIRLNSIFSSTGLGIDLGGDGVTLNNSVGHTGPNDYQNFPVITSRLERGGHDDSEPAHSAARPVRRSPSTSIRCRR